MKDSSIKMPIRIEELASRPSRQNIVYLDPIIMRKMNLKKRNFIELIGEKKSASSVYPGKSKDKGLGIIRMDSRVRENIGKKVGDMIEIKKAEALPAEKLELFPIGIIIDPLTVRRPGLIDVLSEDFFYGGVTYKNIISNNPITLYDKILINGNHYVIASLIPDKICVIDAHSDISLISKSMTVFESRAKKTCYRILNYNPEDKDTWYSLGVLYKNEGNYEKAIEAFENFVRVSPNQLIGCILLGKLYNQSGEYDKAIDLFTKVSVNISGATTSKSHSIFNLIPLIEDGFELIGIRFHILYNMGYAYKQKGEIDKAIYYYNNILNIFPDIKSVWNELASIHHTLGEPLKAIEFFKKSLNINEDEALKFHPDYFFNIFIDKVSFKRSDQYLKFKQEFEAQNFDAWYNLAKVYLDLKQYEEALSACEQCLLLEPNSQSALNLKEKIKDLQN
jgi:tetratricopeptide (TPR) repeat protein